MNKTNIEWTDFSANPLKYRDEAGNVVWACVHASPGCQHCYAETLATRYGKGGPFNVPTTAKVTPFLDEKELRRMLTYKPASGKRCFVGDMTDVVGSWVERWMLAQLLATMALRYDVTWQLLTKRADRLHALMTDSTFLDEIAEWVEMLATGDDGCDPLARMSTDLRANAPDVQGDDWPIQNIWIGVSAEDQQRADKRIVELLATPASVRFVSLEPLLGPIDLHSPVLEADKSYLDYLDWVIVGGESGPQSRPCEGAWVRSIVRQCQSAGVPCFVKQLGSDIRGLCGWPHHDECPPAMLDGDGVLSSVSGRPGTLCHAVGDAWWPCRLKTKSRKGSDPSEWPADLRVRQFPCGDAVEAVCGRKVMPS